MQAGQPGPHIEWERRQQPEGGSGSHAHRACGDSYIQREITTLPQAKLMRMTHLPASLSRPGIEWPPRDAKGNAAC